MSKEFEHDVLEQGWGGWAPKRACCLAEEQGRCSWQITLCLDVVVLLGRWRGWEESYQHGVDKWDVIISHMGSSLQSVQAWDISAEGKHLWQRRAFYIRSVLRPGNCRLWGRCGWRETSKKQRQ